MATNDLLDIAYQSATPRDSTYSRRKIYTDFCHCTSASGPSLTAGAAALYLTSAYSGFGMSMAYTEQDQRNRLASGYNISSYLCWREEIGLKIGRDLYIIKVREGGTMESVRSRLYSVEGTV